MFDGSTPPFQRTFQATWTHDWHWNGEGQCPTCCVRYSQSKNTPTVAKLAIYHKAFTRDFKDHYAGIRKKMNTQNDIIRRKYVDFMHKGREDIMIHVPLKRLDARKNVSVTQVGNATTALADPRGINWYVDCTS